MRVPLMKSFQKVGSLFIRPDWRYDAIQNPNKYNLQDFRYVPSSGAGCLKRFLPLGIEFEVNYTNPHFLNYFISDLTAEQLDKLLDIYKRTFKRSGNNKITCYTDQELFSKVSVWNTKKLDKIPDAFLRRLLKHLSLLEHDQPIHEAIAAFRDPNNKEQIRFIGYLTYSGVDAKGIAKRWRIKVKTAEAIQALFFDFSSFPKDRVANLSYLRQLTNIGAFDEEDFAYYKRAFDLGELGVRAQADFYGLTDGEKQEVVKYLSHSLVSNTLNLNFAIRTQKDAYNYTAHVGNLANYYIKQKEVEYFQAKTENIRASTRRLELDASTSGLDTNDTDQMYIDLLREYSLQETDKMPYKSVQDLE